LDGFGEFGSGPGQLDSPAQLAVASGGDVYVADSGNDRIAVFAGDGDFLGTLSGQMSEPQDVALDGNGRAFVADFGDDRIDVFAGEGGFLFKFGESGEGQLASPSGIAVGASTVFVADSGNDRIALFKDSGEFLSSFPTPMPPRDVIAGDDGNLYVANFEGERVDVFTQAGEFVRSIGTELPGKLSGPVALAADGSGGIYVADQIAGRVEHFDDAGIFLGGFAAEPDVAGVGVACSGNVFAVEQAVSFARVERFGEAGTPPPPCVAPASVSVSVAPLATVSNKIRFRGLRRNRRNGTAVVFVKVPGPGRVILHGRGVRRVARFARRAQRLRLPVKPKVRLLRYLRQHGKGRIRIAVTFKPLGGIPKTIEKVVVLRRKRR
jgi:DNA-binding beta-propeller fold protein YncE